MNVEALKGQATRFVVDNASTILTAGGAVGTVVTGLLTARATFQASELIRAEEVAEIFVKSESNEEAEHKVTEMIGKDGKDDETMGLTRGHKILLVWRYYVPPVFVGSATIGSIILANRVSAQRAAALAAAYGLAEGRLQDYRDKVQEKLTGPKNEQLKAELAQDRVNENPPGQVIIVGGGDVLCFDQFLGRYFRSSAEMIKRAEAFINAEIRGDGYVSLSQFYDELGLPATTMSDMVGWNGLEDTEYVEIDLSTVMSPDQKPCLALDFRPAPRYNYDKVV